MMRDLSQYDGLRNLIKTGDLVEFASNGIIGRSIMAFTRKNVSHCSLVIRLPYQNSERRYIIEAIRTGVEFQLLSDVLQHYDGKVIWHGLKKEYDCKRDGIGEWAFNELAQHKSYDFGGVIAQLWGRVSLDSRKYYCSELIDAAYQAVGIIKPDPKGARVPGDFVPLGIFDSQAHLWGEQD
jgi:uncharacterized protein YycO